MKFLSISKTLFISLLLAYVSWNSQHMADADGHQIAVARMRDMLEEVDQQQTTPPPSRFGLSAQRLMIKLQALIYALESTYLPNNATLAKWGVPDAALPDFVDNDDEEIPASFKDFFTATGNNPLEGAEREGYDCANACLAKPQNSEEIGQLKSLSANCSELLADVQCLGQCRENQTAGALSSYVDFLVENTDKLTKAWCKNGPEGTVDVEDLVANCDIGASHIVMAEFVWQKGLNFVNAFLDADNNIERCSAVRKTLVNEFSDAMQVLCKKDEDEVDTMAHFAAGYILALNTDGEIIERCPELYNNNVDSGESNGVDN